MGTARSLNTEEPPRDEASSGTDNSPTSSNDDEHGRPSENKTHHQNVDVHREDTRDEVTISMDVPGFGIGDVEIRMEDQGPGRAVLRVHGKRLNRFGDTIVVEKSLRFGKRLTIWTASAPRC